MDILRNTSYHFVSLRITSYHFVSLRITSYHPSDPSDPYGQLC